MSVTCGCGSVVLKHLVSSALGSVYFASSRNIHISTHRSRYFAPGDYYKMPKEEWSPERFQLGWQFLAKQPKLMLEEAKKKLEDPFAELVPNSTDMWHEFRGPSSLEVWNTGCDSDWDEGYSTCSLTNTQQGYALFSGELNTRAPDTGTDLRGGYCTMRRQRPMKSWNRDAFFDWRQYTHLVMRVRGDGRSYMVNLSARGTYDVTWDVMWQYALFTRGGPYWQFCRIPFSKFFKAYRGRIQDRQFELMKHQISHVGFTMADGINGPFNLEIDYIGLQWDPSFEEEFAYELYKVPKTVPDE